MFEQSYHGLCECEYVYVNNKQNLSLFFCFPAKSSNSEHARTNARTHSPLFMTISFLVACLVSILATYLYRH
jgi:hypothetical protein